jgi:cytochrome c oxidase subunit II
MGMRGNALLIAGLVLVGLGALGLLLLGIGILGGPAPGSAGVEPSAAAGALIFRTGAAPDGRPIPYSGGMMMRIGCAGCHGVDGHGLQTPMFLSPDISYRNLTDPAGMREPGGERGSIYTDDLIRRAVTQGIDAEGKPLAWPMPRWQFGDRDWQDLLTYLKTLP